MIDTEEKLEEAEKTMAERDLMFEELDMMLFNLTHEHRSKTPEADKAQEMINQLEDELQQTKEERDDLSRQNAERQA